MFERSKASLGKLEASVEGAINGVQSKIIGTRREVENFDHGLLTAIDRLGVVVGGARARVVGELSSLRGRITELTPKGS